MNKIAVNPRTKVFFEGFCKTSFKEASWFPVDRAIVLRYLDEILEIDPVEFIFVNLEMGSSVWNNNLFLCLPEVWSAIDTEDIITLMENFTNSIPYYYLLEFTYKYIQIDIIEIILQNSYVKKNFENEIVEFLRLQWYNLVPTKEQIDSLVCNKYLNYTPEIWGYIRQIFLLDERVKQGFNDRANLLVHLRKLLKHKGDISVAP